MWLHPTLADQAMPEARIDPINRFAYFQQL
jgi:hypothetical protein